MTSNWNGPESPAEHPHTYTDDDGNIFPAAIIDRRPTGGYTGIEYIDRDGNPVRAIVDDGQINADDD